jgi:lysophospholipase L1-like esterase
VKITGGGGAEVCAIADDGAPKITIRQVYASEDLGEKGTRTLQSDMICCVFELSTSGTHAKPFVMKRARGFFVSIGFLIYLGFAQTQLRLAASSIPLVWVATWGSSQQIPEPQNELPIDDLRDATVRQLFHLSVGGSVLRVHMSNAFGTEALHFSSVHVARPLSTSSSAIDPTSDRQLTFAGKPDVLVPPGAEFVSDPVNWKAAPLSDLAVTFHLDTPPAGETSHPGARATSYFVHGDAVGAATLIEPKHVDHWFQISEIDVQVSPKAGAVVVLGDSITDGHGATTNGNDRWTDVLAARLQGLPQTRNIGVSNQGIGGNHLLTDGLGPNALSRFDRDVLAPAGVRWLIVFEGVNDLGGLARNGEVPPDDHAALVERVLSAYGQLVERAHAHGLRVFGATITPYVGSNYYHPDPPSEADRQAVNQWIRAAGHFDGMIDFDAVVRDPKHPDQLLPDFDCGDHLHPSPAGYKAMGEAIPLSIFSR